MINLHTETCVSSLTAKELDSLTLIYEQFNIVRRPFFNRQNGYKT